MNNRIFKHADQISGVGSLDPAAIFAELETCPPLMREEAQGPYLGRQVTWMLHFADGSTRQGEAYLVFRVEGDGLRMITGTAALADYPWLKSLRANERVRVRGRIRRVGALTIELGMLELERPPRSIVPSNN